MAMLRRGVLILACAHGFASRKVRHRHRQLQGLGEAGSALIGDGGAIDAAVPSLSERSRATRVRSTVSERAQAAAQGANVGAAAQGANVGESVAGDPFWTQQAHSLRTEINIVAAVLWLACLGAVVLPRKRDSKPEKASISTLRLVTRIVGGISLGVLTVVYLFSYGPVRHAVMHNSLVKNALSSSFHKRDGWIFHRISEDLPAKGSRILNFGAGGNTFSDFMVEQGYDVTPLDIVDESIAKTPVVVYDGVKIPESLGQFDAAVISTVLHHIQDQYIDAIIADLAGHAKKIIIFEDVARHNHHSFVETALYCVKMNLELFNHPLNFRSHEAWKERFSKYNVVKERTDGHFSVLVLQP